MIIPTLVREVVAAEFLTLKEKRQLIERIADSDLFRRAPKLREFLLYAAACTLEDRMEDVRGQAIAEKVFHRTFERYDADDTIVRAEARNLRKRLETFFETEGAAEPFILVMPKGGYSIAFRPRSEKFLADSENNGSAAPLHMASSIPSATAGSNGGGFWSIPQARFVLLLCGFLGMAAVLTTALAIRAYPDAKLASTLFGPPDMLPFSALFDSRHDTLIVTSDTGFLKVAEIAGRRLTLNDYLAHAYPDVPHLFPPDLIRNLNWSQFTDASETKIAGLIMRKNAQRLQRAFLRSGRQVQLPDFQSQNVILLGSPVSNPWAELYANELNFQFDSTRDKGIQLRNRSPHSGESSVYPGEQDNQLNRKYAQIAFIPNTSPGKTSALLIAGTTAEATEAAGEFVLDDAGLARTLRKIGVDPTGPPRYWELLLRATTFVGGATHSEVISYRLRPYSVE
jgi:hypothetical protein